jgi:DNA-binding IclR family transcriptional regulator
MSGARREPGRTVTSKAFAILASFTPGRRELSLVQITDLTGLPRATAFRLTRELVLIGALEQTDGRRYRIGVKLWQTGSLASLVRRLNDRAAPVMQDLHDSLGAGVQLALHDGGPAPIVINKVVAAGTNQPWPVIATRLPLHATAAGKLALADLTPESRVAALQRRLHRYTPHTIVAPGLLLASMRTISSEGVAVQRDEVTEGWSAVAAPIRTSDGLHPASLAVAMRSNRFNVDKLAPRVRDAATLIATRLD